MNENKVYEPTISILNLASAFSSNANINVNFDMAQALLN